MCCHLHLDFHSLENRPSRAMSGFLLPVLYALAGVCGSAALHHGLIARRRPLDPIHLLFALLCLLAGAYIAAKAGAYQAASAPALVTLRRWELSAGALAMAALPWFVGHYTGWQPRWLLISLSAGMLAVMAANLVLPYGIAYVSLPTLRHFTLPWGEQVVDQRLFLRGAWFQFFWLDICLVFAYSAYACVRHYRGGARHQAVMLARGLGLFMALTLFNIVVDGGLVHFTHTAEFGFMALVLTMSLTLTRELRESEHRMQAVLDHVPAVVFLKDTAGRYLWANRQYAELTGTASGALIGKTDYDLFPRAQAEAIRANDRQVLESRQPIEFEEAKGGSGTPRSFASLKFPLLDGGGNAYAVCGISTDVTELRKTQGEMRRLRHQVWHADRVERTGAITASLAHELSQPLTAVLANAQAGLRFLARDKPDLDELRAILQDIVRDDKRAATVIAGLRAMLRRQDTPRESIDLGPCIQEVLNLLHSEFLAHTVDMQCALATRCRVLADKAQIQQVVLNLVLNAIEAMEHHPADRHHLRVALADTGKGEARVAVCDNGEGIAGDLLDKVFDGFYTTKTKGLGMGLAVCRSIVEAHGGEIWAERNTERGVTFFFTLPLAK
jgi:PAS domain S-box-containing protein